MSLNPFRTSSTLFAIGDFRRLWIAGALTGVARWLEFIALGIYAYELTRSPPLVALLAVLRMMPYVAFGFLVGALADRFDRRRLMMLGTFTVFATAAVMCVLTASGNAGFSTIAAATMVSGAFWTIDMPVRRRILVDAAGRENVAAALGLDNSTNYATRAIGPLIGGIAYQLLGIEGIYVLIAVCYFACFDLATRLTVTRAATAPSTPSAGWLAALKVPRELIFNRRFAVIMGVTLVYNMFCFPFTTMVPVIAQKDFLLVPILVGALSACEGIGGTFGALLVGMFGSERTLFRYYYFGTVTLLVLMFGLSFHLTVPTAVAVLLLTGMAASAFSATQYALVHVIAPPEVRGRATGVLSLFIGSSMIGHYMAGQLFGVFPSAEAMRIMAASGLSVMLILGGLWWTATTPAPGRA